MIYIERKALFVPETYSKKFACFDTKLKNDYNIYKKNNSITLINFYKSNLYSVFDLF